MGAYIGCCMIVLCIGMNTCTMTERLDRIAAAIESKQGCGK